MEEKQGSAQITCFDDPGHHGPEETTISFVSPARRAAVWRGALYAYRGDRWSTALAFEHGLVADLR